MTKKNQLRTLFLLALLFLAAPVAFAMPTDKGPAGDQVATEKGHWRDQIYKDLNLTAEQKKLLDENKNQNRQEMKALFQSIKDKRALLQQELQKDQLDMGKINQIQGEMKEFQGKMLDRRLTGILEVRKILTPEQFKKFLSHTDEHQGHSKSQPKGSGNWFHR
jgi:Spy/CpxP family protein refolding chaperone